MSAAGGRRVVLATRNPHKVDELRRILAARRPRGLDLVSLADHPDVADVAETGLTFVENALLKATAVAAATGLPCDRRRLRSQCRRPRRHAGRLVGPLGGSAR